jgi:hypothetical protein
LTDYQEEELDQVEELDNITDNRSNLTLMSTLRRPRAETMPTQSTSFPYNTATDHLSIDPTRPPPQQSCSFFDKHWLGESLQSPTTPTTDQLLKGDDNNTIASTFASLGLDEHHASPTISAPSIMQQHQQQHQQQQQIHTSHSYSSLQSLSKHQQQEWDAMTYYRGEDLRSSVANLRYQQQQQQNRPRAMSAVDQAVEDTNSHLPQRSIWYSDLNNNKQSFNQRPFLRSSNSSADLLEMIARQRKATATAANSPSGSHVAIHSEDMQSIDGLGTGWTGVSYYLTSFLIVLIIAYRILLQREEVYLHLMNTPIVV